MTNAAELTNTPTKLMKDIILIALTDFFENKYRYANSKGILNPFMHVQIDCFAFHSRSLSLDHDQDRLLCFLVTYKVFV